MTEEKTKEPTLWEKTAAQILEVEQSLDLNTSYSDTLDTLARELEQRFGPWLTALENIADDDLPIEISSTELARAALDKTGAR